MPVDYDLRRQLQGDELDETLGSLRAGGAGVPDPVSVVDEPDLVESPELPGADLSGLSADEVRVPVPARQPDEFVCSRCFLIQHRRRLAHSRAGRDICRDCA